MSTQTDAGELEALLAGIEPINAMNAADLLESLVDEDGDEAVVVAAASETDDKVVTFGNEESDAPTVEIDTKAIYEEQGSAVKVADEEEATTVAVEGATTEKGKKRARKAKTKDPSASSTPAPIQMNRFTSKSEVLAAKADVTAITALGVDEATIKKALDQAPLKVREKAYNVLRFAAGREAISNYTKAALCWLRDAPGMTTVNLVEKFKAGDPALGIKAYNDGTARSQAQQMSRLFGILGIVNVSGKSMTLRDDHDLVKALLGRLPAAA
jgi:hypothetical protein